MFCLVNRRLCDLEIGYNFLLWNLYLLIFTFIFLHNIISWKSILNNISACFRAHFISLFHCMSFVTDTVWHAACVYMYGSYKIQTICQSHWTSISSSIMRLLHGLHPLSIYVRLAAGSNCRLECIALFLPHLSPMMRESSFYGSSLNTGTTWSEYMTILHRLTSAIIMKPTDSLLWL